MLQSLRVCRTVEGRGDVVRDKEQNGACLVGFPIRFLRYGPCQALQHIKSRPNWILNHVQADDLCFELISHDMRFLECRSV